MAEENPTYYAWRGGVYTLETAPSKMIETLRERGMLPAGDDDPETGAGPDVGTDPVDAPQDMGAPTSAAANVLADTIDGVGKTRAERLVNAGIHSLQDLADAVPGQLAGRVQVGTDQVESWIDQAQQLVAD